MLHNRDISCHHIRCTRSLESESCGGDRNCRLPLPKCKLTRHRAVCHTHCAQSTELEPYDACIPTMRKRSLRGPCLSSSQSVSPRVAAIGHPRLLPKTDGWLLLGCS